MKKFYIIIILAGIISLNSFSQEKEKRPLVPNKPFWSGIIDAGVIVPTGNFSNTYKTSLSLGLEIAYNPKPFFAVFVNFNYNFLNVKDSSNGSTPAIMEFGAGGRLYAGAKRLKFFLEAGIGDYVYHYTLYYGVLGAPSSYSSGYFGVKGGIGADWALGNLTTIFVKSNYHLIFTSGTKTTYFGAYVGIRNMF